MSGIKSVWVHGWVGEGHGLVSINADDGVQGRRIIIHAYSTHVEIIEQIVSSHGATHLVTHILGDRPERDCKYEEINSEFSMHSFEGLEGDVFPHQFCGNCQDL